MESQEPFHSRQGLSRILLITGFLISVALSAAYLVHPSFVDSTNNRTTDVVMALAPEPPISDSIIIVDIDDDSLAHYGQWPWPRFRLAQLLQAINASGAASIGLDLILAEPDRTSPPNPTIDLNREPVQLGSIPGGQFEQLDHDHILAETLTQGPFVLGYDLVFRDNSNLKTSCGLHPPGIVWVNIPVSDRRQAGFFKAQSSVCNRKMFSDAVTNSGFLNATLDADGVLRRVPMLIRFNEELYPSLILAMLMKKENSNQLVIQRRENERLELRVESKSLTVDSQGNMIVRFSRPAAEIPRISAADLLNGQISSNRLHNKFVLVGFSAAGLDQTYQTPAGPIYSHAVVHAQALNNLLTGQQVIRTSVFLSWEVLIGILVAIAASLSIARFAILPSAALSLTFLAVIWVSAVLVFQTWGYLLSPLLPTVLVVLNFALLTIIKTRRIERAAWKRTESTLVQLKASEKKLNSIINAIPDIIFRLDTAGRITFISPAISKYGTTPGALLGKSIFDMVAPEDLPKARFRLNERRIGDRAIHGLELRLLLPRGDDGISGEVGHFCISAEGIYQNDLPCTDEFIGTQGILRDITDQKKLEEKLVNAQKLEAIGSLAAGVAHDLNNILAGLVSYPDLLLMKLPKDSPLREDIALIQRSGKSAAAIVQDLLTLGRRGIQINVVVDLNAVITDYLGSLEAAAILESHPNITLESDLSPELLRIKGSKVHLVKAIMNLLTNAAEAMPAGGRISLTSYNKYLDVPLKLYEEIPPGEYVCVSVADEGVGIVGEDFQRIFEPFYSKKSMKRSGSGLGMTVIWSTIKDHGGFIDLRSREGEGTRFVFYIPATRDQEELSSPRVVLEDYLGTEQLLVVDDAPEQIQIASGMLTRLGYRVAAVTSGEAAIVYIRGNSSVDLVLLDMIMPGGMDGLETYRKILEIYPGMRAIITSGFSESERVKTLQKLGAGAYVQKPYTLERLGVAVRSELDLPEKKARGTKEN